MTVKKVIGDPAAYDSKQQGGASKRGMTFCTLAFLLCVLLSVTPLNRLAGTTDLGVLPTNSVLISVGGWLPLDLGLARMARTSQVSTHDVLFLLLVALEFLVYALALRWLQRRLRDDDHRWALRMIWLGTIVTGIVFVLTPAMLSHDIFAYAAYGRILAVYHANPYFVTLSAFPHDPFLPLDNWKDTPSAYGPLWTALCGLLTLCAGDHALAYVLLYRVLGLASHLLNTLLVYAILHRMGYAPRTIACGTLLYGWNPLALQESCLGGHNDTWMVTFMLLGLLLCVRAEQNARLMRGYLLPVVAFSLAILVKFACLPLVAFFFILLLRKALYPSQVSLASARLRALHWRGIVQTLLPAGLLCGGLVAAAYVPFWLGHSVHEVVQSFLAPPAANASFGSVLEAVHKWVDAYGSYAPSWASPLISPFAQRATWQYMTYGIALLLAGSGVVWIWRSPTVPTLALATLALLGGLLIVTPWFVPWYVTWLVGLAALALPPGGSRNRRALLLFTLVFSATAHFVYFFFYNPQPFGGWIGLTFLTTIGPPILTLFICLLLPGSPHEDDRFTHHA